MSDDNKKMVPESEFRKATEAIAIKPVRGRMTMTMRRLHNVFLAHSQKLGLAEERHSMPLSQLMAGAEFESNNTERLKEDLRELTALTVEWSEGVQGARKWGVSNLLTVQIIETGSRCTIEWSWPTFIRERLIKPDVYAKLTLAVQNKLRSNAALALYEIAMRYIDSPAGLTMRREWAWWRPVLTGMADAGAQAYLEYKYFKRDVLKPAVAEVNALTAVEIEMIEHKIGRSISELQFRVGRKRQEQLDLDDQNLYNMALIERLGNLGFSSKQINAFYAKHEESALLAAMDYTEKRMRQQPPLDSAAAYYRKALTQGYAAAAKKLEESKPKRPAIVAPVPNLKEDLINRFLAQRKRDARAAFDAADPAQQAALLDACVATASKPVKDQAQRLGLKSQIVAAELSEFLVKDLPPPTDAELLAFSLQG